MKLSYVILSFVLMMFACIGCSTTNAIQPMSRSDMESQMRCKLFVASNGVQFVYREHCPDVADIQIPIVFYLHGAGQRGIDNIAQLDVGVGSLMSLTEEKQEYQAVVVAPQCPAGVYWRDDKMLDALAEFISRLSDRPYVDKKRIVVTGYSMGGDATWKLAVRYPQVFRTAVPICGGPLQSMEPDRPEFDVEKTAQLNIWAFNNFDDTIVRPNFSKYMFSKIWGHKIDDRLNFTESIDGGHDASNVYKDRKYMIWMLSVR